MPRHCLLNATTSIVVALVPGTVLAQSVRVDSAHREVVVTVGPYDIPADSGMGDMMSSIADDELSPKPALDRSNAIYIRGRNLRTWESAMSKDLPGM